MANWQSGSERPWLDAQKRDRDEVADDPTSGENVRGVGDEDDEDFDEDEELDEDEAEEADEDEGI